MKIDFFKKGLSFFVIAILLITTTVTLSEENSSKLEIKQTYETYTNEKPNIMVTGFWNPTGQMIAQFSTNTELNPEGWMGENWEDLGFDIYSFFPDPDTYSGDFEVDYQDTWEDFWRITDELNPIAIVSFGAGAGPWEIEYNAVNRDSWVGDETAPFQPTPNPPDDTVPPDYVRHSTLPVQNIEDAVNQQTAVDAWVDWDGNPGRYLCNYMAYLVMWYQNMHNSTDDESCCKSAGFIHVNANVPVEDAKEAAEISIRETISYIKSTNLPPEAPTIDGPTEGKANEAYEYMISSYDPEGDQVSYWIEWSDEDAASSWDGPFESGSIIVRSHSWNEQGSYTISVKAKDEYNAESEWTQLEISMPKSRQNTLLDFLSFLQRFIQHRF